MTGRELIVYILENGLEDKQVFEDGKFIGFKTMHEVAEELSVGTACVDTWCKLGMLPNVQFGTVYLIPGNYKSPLERKNEES